MNSPEQSVSPVTLALISSVCLVVSALLAQFDLGGIWLWAWVGLSVVSLFLIAGIQVNGQEKHEVEVTPHDTFAQEREALELTISSVKKENAEISQEHAMYQGVLDMIPDWVYVKDKEHRYIYANKSFLKAIPALKIGQSDDLFMPADFCRKIWEDERIVINQGRPIIDVEEQGGDAWYSTTKIQWLDGNVKGPAGIIGVTRNVTEAVNNRLAVHNHSLVIEQKIDRIHEIKTDTGTVQTSTSDCSEIVSKMTEIIEEISNKNQNIESALELIKGLASQSKMLSINAAIEAAKAGDTGKGFGVVAHEVRELAERSESAVIEIEAAIKSSSVVISSGTGAMQATKDSFDKIFSEVDSISNKLDVLTVELNQA